VIAVLLLVLGATAPAEPTYLVERIITMGGEVRRTSVFRQGVAVVSIERPGSAKRIVRQPLTEVELSVFTQIAEESYVELGRLVSLGQALGEGRVELRLAPVGKDPLIVRYPISGVPPMAAVRVGQALDGLEAALTRLRVSREDLRDWVPSLGDRVELEDGRIVEVLEVLPDGDRLLVRAQIGEGPASIFVSAEDLRRMALRRIRK
jgi:hypothetical protein